MLLGPTQAMVLAAGSSAGALAWRRARPWLQEVTLLLVAFAIWQEALDYGVRSTTGAASRGMDVWRLERWLHLPSERSIQHLALRAPDVMRAFNLYYVGVHVQDVLVCLLWLFWRHRDRYRPIRRVLLVSTAVTAVVQFVPVAPPRLLPATGVVDAGRLLGYAVYSPAGLHDSSQTIAMPSVHVAFAVWVAYAVIRASSSRWRWLVLAHPILTVASVIAPGYHFWLDAVAGAAIVALAAVVSGREPRAGRPHEVEEVGAVEPGLRVGVGALE